MPSLHASVSCLQLETCPLPIKATIAANNCMHKLDKNIAHGYIQILVTHNTKIGHYCNNISEQGFIFKGEGGNKSQYVPHPENETLQKRI